MTTWNNKSSSSSSWSTETPASSNWGNASNDAESWANESPANVTWTTESTAGTSWSSSSPPNTSWSTATPANQTWVAEGTAAQSWLESSDSGQSWSTEGNSMTTWETQSESAIITAPSGLSVTSGATEALIQPDGSVFPRAKLSWTATTDTRATRYEIQFKKSADSQYMDVPIVIGRTTATAWVDYLQTGVAYDFRIRAVDGQIHNVSEWVEITSQTITGQDSTLPPPTQAPATGGLFSVVIAITPNVGTRNDIASTEVWTSATNDRTAATLTAVVPWPLTSATLLNLSTSTFYYWTRQKDTSGNYSDWYPSGATSGLSAAPDNASIAPTLSTISADMGSLTAGQIVVGSTNKMWLNESADGVLAVGGTVKGSAPFHVSATGALTATSATITGAITSTSGTIGGWSIGSTSLTSGSGSNTVGADSGGSNPAFYAGSATPGSAPFRVTQAGSLTSTSGSIGGWTLASGSMSAGNLSLDATNTRIQAGPSANTYVRISPDGITGVDNVLGTTFNLPTNGSAPTFSSGIINSTVFNITSAGILETSANAGNGTTAGVRINDTGIKGWNNASGTPQFHLDATDGTLTATGATISGAITSTSGSIGGWTLGSTSLTSGSGSTTVGLDSGGSNPALYAGSATPASAPFRVTNAGALTATNADITGGSVGGVDVDGGLTVGTSGHVKGGQTDYNTGTGFFLGYSGAAYKFSIGNSSGNYILWDGSSFTVNGAIIASGNISSVNADTITSGSIRSINVNSASHTTKGTYLTASLSGAESTVTVHNTADFASSGTAVVIDTTNDRDEFTYTGKTSTTLTGCSGVLAHNSGATVIPLAKGMAVDGATNEMRFYGDRGDGTIMELANIGIYYTGSDYAVLRVGDLVSGMSRTAVYANSYTGTGVNAQSSSGIGVRGYSASNWAGYFVGNSTKGNISLSDVSSTPSDTTTGNMANVSGTPMWANGSAWQSLLPNVVQVVEATPYTSFTSVTTATPDDNTIPQSTEGSQIVTATITPKSTTNRLLIMAQGYIGNNSSTMSNHFIMHLHQDSTANALASTIYYTNSAVGMWGLHLTHEMAAGTTSATTFKIRVGGDTGGGTWYINGHSNQQRLGGTLAWRLRVIEIRA